MLAFLFFSVYLQASDFSTVATSREWQTLLHIENKRSLITSKSFFLSDTKSAEDELEATYKAILAPYSGDGRKDPQCRFPARSDFIFKTFGIDKKLRRPCAYWKEWQEFLAIDQVSLVFASSYMSSASSLFGHTFLKLRSKKSKGQDLLDYSLDAAAMTGADTGLVFSMKGIFGFYPARFSLLPYHMKVKEYVHIEGRDLWEFPLDLTKEQKIKLLHHIIEIEEQDFPYYYFDYNCSYLVLSLIQVLFPEKDLVGGFWFSTIPFDTLKSLQKNSVIDGFKFRPSNLRVIEAKWLSLTRDEKRQVLSDKNAESAKVLEVKMDLTYLKSNQGVDLENELYQLQLQRAKLGPQKTFLAIDKPKKSILSEWPTTFIGLTASNNTAGLHLLPAMKDQLTPSEYMSTTSISLLETKIDYKEDELTLRKLTLLEMKSYPLYTELFKNASYELSLSYKDDIDRTAYTNFSYALGYSFLLLKNLQWQVLGSASSRYQSRSASLGLGYVNQLVLDTNKWSAVLRQDSVYYSSIRDDKRYQFSVGRKLFKEKQLRFNYIKTEAYTSLSELEFIIYF